MNKEARLRELLNLIERINHSHDIIRFIVSETKGFPMVAGTFIRPLRAIHKLADNSEKDIRELRIQLIQAIHSLEEPCSQDDALAT